MLSMLFVPVLVCNFEENLIGGDHQGMGAQLFVDGDSAAMTPRGVRVV